MTKLSVNGTETEMGDKSLTIICHQDGIDVAPGADGKTIAISPEMTVARTARLGSVEWSQWSADPTFRLLWDKVFTFPPPADPSKATVGERHVIGLLALLAEAMVANKVPLVQYPETYLHPKSQAGLADVLAWFATGGGKRQSAESA